MMFWPHFQPNLNERSEDRLKVQGFNGDWFEISELTDITRLDWIDLYFRTWLTIIASKGKRLQMPLGESDCILPPEIRNALRRCKLLTFAVIDSDSGVMLDANHKGLFEAFEKRPGNGEHLPKKDGAS